MTEISSEADVRLVAAEQLALAALVAMERMAIALRQESPLDRLADELDGLAPRRILTSQTSSLQTRSTDMMARHVLRLQDLRDRTGNF